MTLLYMDTSALFKRYVEEHDSEAVLARIDEAPAVGTAVITRVEVAAALAGAVRAQRLDRNEAEDAERQFLGDFAGSSDQRLRHTDSRESSHLLLISLFGSEVAKDVLQIVYYRRGI